MNKKTTVIIVGIIVLGFITLVVVFLSLEKNRSGVNSSIKPTPVSGTSYKNIENTTNIYDGSFFKIDYPENWEVLQYYFGKNHDILEITFRPVGLPKADYTPSIMVTKFPNVSQDFVNERIDLSKKLYKTKLQTTLNGISVIKAQGVHPYHISETKVENKKVQNTWYYIFENGDLIVVRFQYFGDVINPTQEEFFDSYISTFTLK